MSLLDELSDRWTPEPNTGCYLWHGVKSASWRPKMLVNGKMSFIARLVCEETNGPPPTPMHLAAHSTPSGCVGEACVNGAHLRWASKRENAFDIPLEQRSKTASERQAKHTPEQRKENTRKALEARWKK